MLNRLDANIIDTYNLNSSFSYLGEEDIDKSTNGTPVPDKMKEDGKRKGVIGKIGGIGADSNEATRNGRRYPLQLWQNVEKSEYFKEGMENRCIVGECDHPAERLDYSIPEGAIVLTKYDIRNDGKVYTEFDILDTLPGRTLKTYFDAGCKLGVSSRGLGEEIMVDGEKIIDPDTYQFYCFDAVVFPAVKSARMELIESTSPKKQQLINSITKEINNCKTLDECLFIENMSKDTNLYLDEIKESLESKKEQLSKDDEKDNTQDNTHELAKSIVDKIDKKTNKTKEDSQLSDFLKAWLGESTDTVESLFAQLKESMTDGYVGKTWSEVIDKLKEDGYDVDSAYVDHAPHNEEEILLFKDDKTYKALVNKYFDGGYEILRDTIKAENIKNNKIKISGPKENSDEDTPETLDREPDDKLEILAELQEEVKTKDSNINALNKQLEMKSATIKSLLVKNLESSKLVEAISNEKQQISESLESKTNEFISLSKRYENLQKANKEFSTMLEQINNEYTTSLKSNKSLKEKIDFLRKNSNSLKQANVELKESLNSNIAKQNKVKQLTESITTLNTENESLKSKISSLENKYQTELKMNESLKTSNSSLKSQVSQSLDKYIESICLKYNIKEDTLRRLLGENYTVADIDKTALELVENISKINSLPYANVVPNRRVVYENIGLIENDDTSTKELEEAFSFMVDSKK